MFKQIWPDVDFFLNRAAGDFYRRKGMAIRLHPFFRHRRAAVVALERDSVNFHARRDHRRRHRAPIILAVDAGHPVEQETEALRFFEAAKLPAHDRVKLGVLVDRAHDAPKLVCLFQCGKKLPEIFVVGHALLLDASIRSSPSYGLGRSPSSSCARRRKLRSSTCASPTCFCCLFAARVCSITRRTDSSPAEPSALSVRAMLW